ncbi:translation initiation factor IF-2-like [Lemur catta]|uniref:translation initiation factor IF-2-like n=1 Tax=Lemur catta TaxID=9447 RepID=UPI001E26B004|nr:translation initiation factor IF-2-like [Lemur catta]
MARSAVWGLSSLPSRQDSGPRHAVPSSPSPTQKAEVRKAPRSQPHRGGAGALGVSEALRPALPPFLPPASPREAGRQGRRARLAWEDPAPAPPGRLGLRLRPADPAPASGELGWRLLRRPRAAPACPRPRGPLRSRLRVEPGRAPGTEAGRCDPKADVGPARGSLDDPGQGPQNSAPCSRKPCGARGPRGVLRAGTGGTWSSPHSASAPVGRPHPTWPHRVPPSGLRTFPAPGGGGSLETAPTSRGSALEMVWWRQESSGAPCGADGLRVYLSQRSGLDRLPSFPGAELRGSALESLLRPALDLELHRWTGWPSELGSTLMSPCQQPGALRKPPQTRAGRRGPRR